MVLYAVAAKEAILCKSHKSLVKILESSKEVTVSVSVRHHCFGARGVSAIRSVSVYPADAISFCFVQT